MKYCVQYFPSGDLYIKGILPEQRKTSTNDILLNFSFHYITTIQCMFSCKHFYTLNFILNKNNLITSNKASITRNRKKKW